MCMVYVSLSVCGMCLFVCVQATLYVQDTLCHKIYMEVKGQPLGVLPFFLLSLRYGLSVGDRW